MEIDYLAKANQDLKEELEKARVQIQTQLRKIKVIEAVSKERLEFIENKQVIIQSLNAKYRSSTSENGSLMRKLDQKEREVKKLEEDARDLIEKREKHEKEDIENERVIMEQKNKILKSELEIQALNQKVKEIQQ